MRKVLGKALLLTLLAAAALGPGGALAAKELSRPKDSIRRELQRSQNSLAALEKRLKEYRQSGDSFAVSLALAQIGRHYNHKSDYVQAISHIRRAAELQKGRDDAEYVSTLISLSTNCRRIGAYSSASEYLFEALDILDRSKGKESPEWMRQKSYVLNGIGNVYKYLNNGAQAEKYFRESLALDVRLGNELGQAMNWNTLGSIYEYRSQYDSAALMFNRALEHNLKLESRSGVGICYNSLAQLANLRGLHDEAKKHFLLAYEVLSSSGDKWNLAKTTSELGKLYIEEGDYAKAAAFLDESESLVQGNASYGHLYNIHDSRAQMYHLQGRDKEAYREMTLCLAYRDSSFNQRSGQMVAQARLRYEQEKSQLVINRLAEEQQKAMAARGRTLTIFLSILAVMAVAALAIFNYARMQRKRSKELEELNLVKNKFFSIISHDLKNPVVSQNRVLELMERNFSSIPASELKTQVGELRKSSSSLLALLTNLLSWAKLETGKFQNNPVRFNLKDLAEESVALVEEQRAAKNISLDDRLSPECFLMADRNIVSTALRNLLSNALKFTGKGGRVELSCAPAEGGKVRVSVSDNGVGLSPKAVENLLDLGKQQLTAGTEGEQGTGMGLLVCNNLLEIAGSKLEIESKPGQGSVFSFVLDKA